MVELFLSLDELEKVPSGALSGLARLRLQIYPTGSTSSRIDFLRMYSTVVRFWVIRNCPVTVNELDRALQPWYILRQGTIFWGKVGHQNQCRYNCFTAFFAV